MQWALVDPTGLLATLRMTNSIPIPFAGGPECSGVRGCSIKGSHLSAWHTVQINMKERERDGTGHSCGQGDHFLPAVCSSCFCQFYISQHYTAEHHHHCYQWQTGEGSVGCVYMIPLAPMSSLHFKFMWKQLQCAPYNHILSFYRKRPFRPFPWRPAHPVMLGRCGWQWEGHRLTPFGSARTTSGSPMSESQPTSECTPRIIREPTQILKFSHVNHIYTRGGWYTGGRTHYILHSNLQM